MVCEVDQFKTRETCEQEEDTSNYQHQQQVLPASRQPGVCRGEREDLAFHCIQQRKIAHLKLGISVNTIQHFDKI